MTTHDAPTEPVTYLTITTEHLLRLDAAYPAARWWLKANDEGDWAGPVLSPMTALAHAAQAWGMTDMGLEEILESGVASIGVFQEDVITLVHQDLLVQAGVNGDLAAGLAGHLQAQLEQAVDEHPGDFRAFGFRPVFEVTDEGEILLAPLLSQPAEVSA